MSPILTRKVMLFHWSWANIITQAHVLSETGDVEDREQQVLLTELQRFLLHPSSGVKEFDQMPAAWSEICSKAASGSRIGPKDSETHEVAGSWHQALDQVTTVLSRQVNNHVRISLTRAEATDPQLRLKNTASQLSTDSILSGELTIPDAAAPVRIAMDLGKRTVSAQMWLKAPADRVTTKARLTWLTKQLIDPEDKDVHIRFYWPGRAAATQFPLSLLRSEPDRAVVDRSSMSVVSFDILMLRDIGGKFAQRKLVVSELLKLASDFHLRVGSRLSTWQAKPPKIAEGKVEPNSVSAEGLRDQVERDALQRE
ncbi:MAG TPA: hypothetical protein PKG84_06400 [Novosphingobium sp.]|nr:hypothetical protein [Novosphingobium sp.]